MEFELECDEKVYLPVSSSCYQRSSGLSNWDCFFTQPVDVVPWRPLHVLNDLSFVLNFRSQSGHCGIFDWSYL